MSETRIGLNEIRGSELVKKIIPIIPMNNNKNPNSEQQPIRNQEVKPVKKTFDSYLRQFF
ncbi:MAG: hypothetical protein PHP97_04575 [Candidatus Shapirobacteria bacterium]|nr:hypothetical protein [Candidatus Shapirobacteria bacterium]MDD3002994.1 hypothetical protein [Candidatus Shapirobacteria bacterium]MDD4383138.1 hypothetical protein [Candidatus Shapirobacteria bacterium]